MTAAATPATHGADPSRSTRASVLIPFAICTAIWGSTWIVIRDQLGVVPPSWSVTYRFLVAGVAMAAWALWRGESLKLDRRGIVFACTLGFFQFVGNFNFVYRAEHHITSGLVAVIFALMLVPNAVLGRIFLKQKLGPQLLVGSVIAIAGVALLLIHELRADPAGAGAVALGIALTLGGVMSASTSNIMQGTSVARAYPMAAMLAVAMLAGAAMDGAFAWITTGPPTIDPRPAYIAGVLYLGLAASALAFPLYFGVIRAIGPAKAAYSGVIVPVIAMLLSTVFEGYRWSALPAAGAVLAGIGLIVALRAKRP